MFLKVVVRSGETMVINSDNIIHVTQNLDGGSIINFIGGSYIVVQNGFSEICDWLFSEVEEKITNQPESLFFSTDNYPSYLPRLPTGKVDKRTTQYKEYIESLNENK